MDERQISEFKRLIENSREIALIPCLQTRGESLLAALALFFSLENFNRKTSLLLGSLPSSLISFNSGENWQNKPTIVINKPSGDKISRMRYEKNNGRVYLHFDSHGVPVRAEDVMVSFSPLEGRPDLFICLGFPDSRQVLHPDFQQRNRQSAVINIDAHPNNTRFGVVNLVDPQNSLIELTTTAIESLDEKLIDQRVGAYLLKGLKLYAASRDFSNDLCRRIAQLVNREALVYVPNPCTTEKTDQLALLEKTIRRLSFYAQKNLAVLKLPYGEYHQINRDDLVFILDELRAKIFELDNFVVLWQTGPSSLQGIVYFDEPAKMQRASATYPGEYSESRGLFSVSGFSDFSTASDEIVNYFLSF